MYLIIVAFGYGIVYASLLLLYALFFKNALPSVRVRSVYSIALILALYAGISFLAGSIDDLDLSNRMLHIFGGGFLAFFVCFLVARDLMLRITRFHFVVFSLLIVSALGVANEIIEYFLQNYTSLSFATSANDTWMDLISNSIGAFIGAICLTPFMKSREVE